jgi:hypothetical protein
MFKLLLILACCTAGFGQMLNPSFLSPLMDGGGGVATLTLTFVDSVPTANVSAVQWTLVLPPGVTAALAVPGEAALSAAKKTPCNGLLCFAYGVNMQVFQSGVVAMIPITIPSTIPPGPLTFRLTKLIAASPGGDPVTVTSTPATLVIIPQYDTTSACTSRNSDGSCTVVSVVLALLAALGFPVHP